MGGPGDPVVQCLPTMREAWVQWFPAQEKEAKEEKAVERSEASVTSHTILKTALSPLS